MKFHVEIVARDNFSPLESVPVQKMVLEQLNRIVGSGKVKERGIYSFERGGFMLVEVGSAEELFDLLGPIQDVMRIKAYPYVSEEHLEAFFKAYEEMLGKKR